MMTRPIAWIGAAAWAVLLGGCVTPQPLEECASCTIPTVEDTPFHAKGRFSAHHEENAFSARFDWQHTPDADEIEFISPMGATVARLTREGDTVTVQKSENPQDTRQAANWETLTTQVFGFPLPVEGLVYWVRGAPTPEAPKAVRFDAAGRLDNLRQQGWEVQYRYPEETREPDLLNIRYGETIGLRLKIDQLLPLQKTE